MKFGWPVCRILSLIRGPRHVVVAVSGTSGLRSTPPHRTGCTKQKSFFGGVGGAPCSHSHAAQKGSSLFCVAQSAVKFGQPE